MKFTRLAPILLVLLVVPLAATAGGWALTSFDELPTSFEAGETYELSYTILQHGKTPVDVYQTSVFVTDSDGNVTEFAATRTGSVGHYAVEVTFPAAGTFTWNVSQGDFAPHDLGPISVTGAVASSTASMGRFLLPAAFVLVVGLLGVQVLALIRKRPQAVRAD